MSQAHDAAGAALGSARVSHNFYFRSLPQLLKDSPDSRAASKGSRFTLWQGVLYPPCLLQLCSPAAQRWQLLQGQPSGRAWAWQSLGGVLFSVGDKKEWGQWHLFPTFSGKARDCSNWYKPQEGWVSLGISGLLGITCVTASMGVLFGILCFPLFSSVIGHPLLVERQWAVTDDIRNEPQCHPPPSPLPFNELCVPRAGLLSQESTAAPALSLRSSEPWRAWSSYSGGAFASSFHR